MIQIKVTETKDVKSILDIIPELSPGLVRPNHLAPLANAIQKAVEPGGLREVFHVPPLHGTTQTILHGLLWLAAQFPGHTHSYVTYSHEWGIYIARRFASMAASFGLEPVPNLTFSTVSLAGGTQIHFLSPGASVRGYSVDGVIVVDAPVKDRASASSATIRMETAEWFDNFTHSRRNHNASVICAGPRWHANDLMGYLIGCGYKYTKLKAIAAGATDTDGTVATDPLNRFPGQSLFPKLMPAEFFAEERKDPRSWASLYQGEPMAEECTSINTVGAFKVAPEPEIETARLKKLVSGPFPAGINNLYEFLWATNRNGCEFAKKATQVIADLASMIHESENA